MGVVEGFIFGSRDLYFRIRRPRLGLGSNFQGNPTTFDICRGTDLYPSPVGSRGCDVIEIDIFVIYDLDSVCMPIFSQI